MTDSPEQTATTGTRTLRRDAAENRERLLRAAWEVFAEHGTEAGVEEIARRAGVGMGTLYRRFPTKEALIQALNDALMEKILGYARQVLAEEQGGGLEAYLWFTGTVMSAHHGGLSRLWQAKLPGADPRREELWTTVGQLLERAKQAGEVREDLTLTDVYLCVVALRSLIDDTAAPAPEVWRRYLAVVLAGFRPAAQPLDFRPADDSLVQTGIPGCGADRARAARS
ncbi:TetR/AcrR family transcriptional regulator [Streptacidiphilus sp. PB12-B1b]|uniref:TetR/AcrR family transcriptional regulator n=1 Tax=Streptacidiphilus sp. PB12-B1b TaxID=2705012 RepID=UPI0015FB249F|nr:TetR/AcrR family transcriptional regulator [Streptacidiphilus sp. PB12-B1b]QMU75478.1 TetR/AcrR family transcriptional regulator [Streptacidiphilus sp. PB12-B1b]